MINSYSKYLVVLFLFSIFFGNAQITKVSSAVKLNNKVNKFKILGKVGDNYAVDRYGSNIHLIDIYNSSLKVISTKQIQIEKDEFLEKIWLQPHVSWILKVQHIKNASVLQATKMDAKFKIAQKIQVLDTIVERKDILENNLRTTLSLNENKLLVYAPIFSQGKVDYFYTKVYNSSMQVVNQVKVKEPNLITNEFVDVFLFNNGAILYISKSEERKDNPLYFFTYIDAKGNSSTHTYYPVMDIFKKLKFEIDNKKNALFISGLFKESGINKKGKNGASQFFTSKLELPNFKNIYTTIVPFSPEFYRELTGKESKLDQPQLFTFYINSIIPKVDGGALVLTESYFKNEEEFVNNSYISITGMSSYSTSTIYNFNDIVSYHIDSLGELVSQDIIRKKQVSQNDGGSYSSFYLMNLQEELKLLFLDEINDDAHLNQATISDKKVAKAFTIMNIGNKDLIPVVKLTKQTAPKELIVPSFNKNKLQLIKISF